MDEPTPRGSPAREALGGLFLFDRPHLEAMLPQRQRPPEIRYVSAGQRVAVDVIDGRKGPEAAGLRLI